MDIRIVEVGPRDGLQNERELVATASKITLINKLAESGLRHIEATSFVNPKWIPQLADAVEVLNGIEHKPGVIYSALVPNRKGMERVRETKLQEIAVFMSASETHNLKNINKSIQDTFPVLQEVVEEAKGMGIRVRGYVSTVFGCPYEGEVSINSTLKVTEALFGMGVDEVSIGDTIGVATPKQVHEKFAELGRNFPTERLAAHFHDTRGTGLANVVAALDEGIRIFDSSIGGLGGCPYAPGAAGNITTEDLVYMLEGMGLSTGVDLDLLLQAGAYIQQQLGRELPSKMLKAHCSQIQQEEGEIR